MLSQVSSLQQQLSALTEEEQAFNRELSECEDAKERAVREERKAKEDAEEHKEEGLNVR